MNSLPLLVAFSSVIWIVLLSQGQPATDDVSRESTISVFDKPVEFNGWKGEVTFPGKLSAINIGLFFPYDPADPLAGPILQAAEMAITEFNSAGGYYGVPFQLKARWSYNPWGAGSKEMIKLVYEDSVWAVIGSLDGTATHIAQQIITKARVPLLSPVSADPTLNYIRIPWIFRLPPDFAVQSKVIAEQGIAAASLKKIGLLTSTDHDGRIFSKEMIACLRNIQVTPYFHFEISSSGLDINELILRLNSYEIEALVIYLPPSVIRTIIARFQKSGRDLTIILPWIPGMKTVEIADLYDGDLYSIQAFSESANAQYAIFTDAFLHRYGMHPPPDAAYTYDAVRLLVHALFKSGLNRSLLREEITFIGTYQGVTGTICWDNGGGNRVEPLLKLGGE